MRPIPYLWLAIAILLLVAAALRLEGLAEHNRLVRQDNVAIRDLVRQLRNDLGLQKPDLSSVQGDPTAAGGAAPETRRIPLQQAIGSPHATIDQLEYFEGAKTPEPAAAESADRNIADSAQLDGRDTGDVLTVTWRARPGIRFTGYLPAGVIEAAERVRGKKQVPLPDNYQPTSLRVVESKLAKVTYRLATAHDAEGYRLIREIVPVVPEFEITASQLAAAGLPAGDFADAIAEPTSYGWLDEEGNLERWLPANGAASSKGPNRDRGVPVLALDVQWFDPAAEIRVTTGTDGEPGTAGYDDDGDGIIDHLPGKPMAKDAGEFGAVGSDDRIVTPSDRAALPSEVSIPIAYGAFVNDRPESGNWLQVSSTELAGSKPRLRILIDYLEAGRDEIRRLKILIP